jgi:hypothetical protein
MLRLGTSSEKRVLIPCGPSPHVVTAHPHLASMLLFILGHPDWLVQVRDEEVGDLAASFWATQHRLQTGSRPRQTWDKNLVLALSNQSLGMSSLVLPFKMVWAPSVGMKLE